MKTFVCETYHITKRFVEETKDFTSENPNRIRIDNPEIIVQCEDVVGVSKEWKRAVKKRFANIGSVSIGFELAKVTELNAVNPQEETK